MNTALLNSSSVLSGEYVVKNPETRTTRGNSKYQLFDIQLGLLPIRVVAWANSCRGLINLSHGQKITINGQFERFFGNWQIRCTSIQITQNHQDEITNAKVKLRALMSWIPDKNLQNFTYRLFQDKEFYRDFSTAPASLSHHHCYIGGLFVHSVDVAWQVFRDQTIPVNDRYLGAIAGLLHDVGKIRTFSCMTRTIQGQLLHHDQLNLEVLSGHLTQLEQQNSDLANALRYLLAWKPTSHTPIPRLDVYEKIRAADRFSAGSG